MSLCCMTSLSIVTCGDRKTDKEGISAARAEESFTLIYVTVNADKHV